MLGRLILAAALVATLAGAALSGLLLSAPRAYACSIGQITFDEAVREADAGAVVQVTAVGGPENKAPAQPAASDPRPPRPRPVFDLSGYGATLRLHELVFGTLPAQFEVDTEARASMERELRSIEATGLVSPCPVGTAVARYVEGYYYLTLLEQTASGWSTYLTFNYRIDGSGSDLLTEPLFDGEKPWSIVLRRLELRRFFAALPAHRIYPQSPEPSRADGLISTPVPADEEVWQLEARVPLEPMVQAIRALHSSARVRPPDTGSGGLLTRVTR
jgi:hypothetical protein